MESEKLSNAESLRVIGHQLQVLGIDAFELEKIGEKYTVWLDRDQPNAQSSAVTGFKSMGDLALAREVIAAPLHFHGSEILGLEVESRLRRSEVGGMPDGRTLDLKMRVLGQYLDLKRADEFAISWRTASVRIRFLQKEQSLSASNLYELGICMYLKRSDNAAPQMNPVNRLAS